MSEISGLPSALGIEAIDLEPTVGGGMTVRVAGRWPRGRPPAPGEPVLVLGAGEGRHRITGMREAIIEQGAWRVRFAVPDDLVPALDGPLALGLGTVLVPVSLTAAPPAAHRIDPELLLNRELRTLEATARVARRSQAAAEARADALEAEVERLRHALADAQREPERLRALLAERDRLRRATEQRAFAEMARREELEAELSAAEAQVTGLHARIRERAERTAELERELRRARRSADEARQAASLESRTPTAVLPSQAPPATARRPVPRRRQARVLSAERALLARALAVDAPSPTRRDAAAPSRRDAAAPSRPVVAAALRAEARLSAATRPPLWSRSRADGGTRVAELEQALESERSAAAGRITALEAEVTRLRSGALRALETVAAFRRELAVLHGAARAAPGVEPEAEPAMHGAPAEAAPPVQADRLSAALARLRERVPDPSVDAAPDPPPSTAPPGVAAPAPPDAAGDAPTDALPRLFRALAAEDPALAGRLLLGVLPAQHLAHARPIAYDLVLAGGACVRVTAGPGGTEIELARDPRGPAATQFALVGSPAAIARYLAAGPVRRRIGRRMARLSGERHAVAALDALLGAPVSLRALVDSGAGLDPALALRLIARSIDPAATRAERFTLAVAASASAPTVATLRVEDGAPPTVTDLALGGPATCTVICEPGALLHAFVGAPGGSSHGATDGASNGTARVLGDARALGLVQAWLARA